MLSNEDWVGYLGSTATDSLEACEMMISTVVSHLVMLI